MGGEDELKGKIKGKTSNYRLQVAPVPCEHGENGALDRLPITPASVRCFHGSRLFLDRVFSVAVFMPHDALDWNPRTPIEVDGAATQKARRLQAKGQIEPLASHVGSPSVSGTFFK